MIIIRNEEFLSKKRAIEMFVTNKLNTFETGTTKGLLQIHQFLFQDIFDFAGQIRNVNISKGNFRFCSVLYINENLRVVEKMPENNIDEIVQKYIEMNIIHPFREGNGRSMRIWLDQMLKKNLKQIVNWENIDREEYLNAMERSPVNSLEIFTLIKNNLTDRIDDEITYLKGIQQSYYYENIYEYDIKEMRELNSLISFIFISK